MKHFTHSNQTIMVDALMVLQVSDGSRGSSTILRVQCSPWILKMEPYEKKNAWCPAVLERNRNEHTEGLLLLLLSGLIRWTLDNLRHSVFPVTLQSGELTFPPPLYEETATPRFGTLPRFQRPCSDLYKHHITLRPVFRD